MRNESVLFVGFIVIREYLRSPERILVVVIGEFVGFCHQRN